MQDQQGGGPGGPGQQAGAGPHGAGMHGHHGGAHPGGPGPHGAYGPMPGWDPWAQAAPPPYSQAGPWGGFVPPGYGPPHAGPPPGAQDFAAAFAAQNGQDGLGALKNFFNFDDGDFWKGALVGAAVVLLLKDETLRETLLGGAARTAEAMKSSLAGLGGEAGSDTTETGEETK